MNMKPGVKVLALFLHNSTWGGRMRGDERRFLEIAKRLIKYGANLYVIEFAPSLQRFYYHAYVYKSLEFKTNKLLYIMIWLIVLSLKFKDYDIIYAYNQDLLNILASLIFKLTRRKPLIVVVQSLQDLELPLTSLRQMYKASALDLIFIYLHRYFLLPLILKLANAIFTVSNHLKTQLTMKYPGAGKKIFITSNGVDLEKFKPLNLKKEYDAIFLGRVHVLQKGLDKLLLVWKRVVSKNPGAKLALVGGFESDRDKELIFRLIDKLNLRSNVTITGFVEDNEVVQLLNKAKVFISLSVYEGFGLSILEALACGLPVIASNLKVFHELHKDLLFYVPNEGYKGLMMLIALLDKCLALTLHDDLVKSLIEALRSHAQSFTWDSVAHKEFVLMKHLAHSKLNLNKSKNPKNLRSSHGGA
jgi:glycosyltransferase involved in cell wall biosynthesis